VSLLFTTYLHTQIALLQRFGVYFEQDTITLKAASSFSHENIFRMRNKEESKRNTAISTHCSINKDGEIRIKFRAPKVTLSILVLLKD